MSDVKNKRVNIYIDNAAAENALDKLQAKADVFNRKIDESRKKQTALNEEIKKAEAAGKSTEKLTKEYTKLSDTIKGNTQSLKENEAYQKKLKEQIASGLNPTIHQQETYVKSLSNSFKHLHFGTQEYINKAQELKKASAQLQMMREQMQLAEKVQRNWFAEAKTVAFGVLIGNTMQAALQSITSYFSGIISGNAKLSDSLADVEKATGLTSEQVRQLNSELSKIDTRTSTENLRQIAIGLGQVGQAATPENVAAIDKIVVALGDEFGGGAKEITNVLSILRNNLQDIKTSDYGGDVARIGNALNELGANGLATAPVVTDIANRIAGVGQTFGVSSGQILGFAATFQELGIETERGSTAIVKLFQKIGAEPEKFAKVAGMSVKEFAHLVNTDMVAAFNAVAVGAKQSGDNNIAFSRILKDLDADGSGAGEVLSKLSANQQILAEKTKLATEALQSQDSITAEFTKKNTTLGAELEKLSKRIGAMISNSFLTQFFTGIIKGLNDITESTASATDQFKQQQAAMNDLQKNVVPLIDRVDELNKKADTLGGVTKLSKDEQVELNKAIVTIGETIPGAILQFDDYGKAIAISTGKAREFIALQQAILKEKNREAIAEQQETLKKLQAEADAYDASLKRRDAQGNLVREVYSTGSSTGVGKSSIVKLTDEEIRARQRSLANLQERIKGIKGIIDQLSGNDLKVPEVPPPADPDGGDNDDYTPTSEELEKSAEKIEKLKEAAQNLIRSVSESLRQSQIPEAAKPFTQLADDFFEQQQQLNEAFKKGFISAEQYRVALQQLGQTYSNLISKATAGQAPGQKPLFASTTAALGGPGDVMKNAVDLLPLDEELTPEQKDAMQANINKFKAYMTELVKGVNEDEELKKEWIQLATGALSEIESIFQASAQNRSRADQRELDATLKKYDAEKKAAERLFISKALTYEQYQQQVAAIDAEAEKKREEVAKKEFERNKKLQMTMAVIDYARSLGNIWAQWPKWDGGFQLYAALAAATVSFGTQVGLISSAKYARGGRPKGPGHESGGISLVDSSTGAKVGEMEGDEGIVKKSAMQSNEVFTVTGTPSQITSTLNSRYGGVQWDSMATLQPAYKTRPYYAVDYPRINTTYERRRFAEGGVMAATGAGAAATQQQAETNTMLLETLRQVQATNMQLMQTNRMLYNELRKGLAVSLKKFDEARDLQNRIESDARFGG